MGIVNRGFSLLEAETLTRSASSVSQYLRYQHKYKLKALSSLPIVLQPELPITVISADDAEEELLLFDDNNQAPLINLIPATPSDVVEDDQFFDVSLEDIEISDQEDCREEEGKVVESKEGCIVTQNEDDEVIVEKLVEEMEPLENGEEEVLEAKEEAKKPKPRFLRSGYFVTQLPIFTQTNDLRQTDLGSSEMLKSEFSKVLQSSKMDAFTQPRRPITRSRSFGDMLCKSPSLQMFAQIIEKPRELKSPRQRRVTVGEAASYLPLSALNGNYSEKNMKISVAKTLREMNTEEVCQWFTSIGLQKCLPLIRDAQLSGEDLASISMNILESLQITTMEDREHLLSAIFNELDNPSDISQKINSAFEPLGSNNGPLHSASFPSMSKSTSSPHLSCLTRNRRSLKLKNNAQTLAVQRNTQFIEIAINVSQQIVHLRTPKETTVGKIVDSCLKMVGMKENRSLFSIKQTEGSSEELCPDRQVGSLPGADNKQLELHLCKLDKPRVPPRHPPEPSSMNGHQQVTKPLPVPPEKDPRIKELNQQVDSLQNIILQVQELHQGLVAFCSELKRMERPVDVERLGSAELKQQLELIQGRLHDKRLALQTLRDNMSTNGFKKKQLEVRLLEKIKLNCEVFKEEISIVHLNRQLAHLQAALQETLIKEKKPKKPIRCLSQLVSPQSPAMLLVMQESREPGGHYSFTCRFVEGSGLVVVQVGNTRLCVDDRLVEVNGFPVVNSTEAELTELLYREHSAQIVVLRRPLSSHQPPLPPAFNPRDPMPTDCPEMDVVTMETPQRRRVIAV
uniref:SAM domain-containing protein n=1 Tax=Knipowitschia caucasica TaxID=637954 RepID=A0AAV2JL63_KNICA